MSMGAQQTGSSTSTQTPPAYMYPYIGTALGQAGNLLQTGGPGYYPGQQVAGFSQPQQQAMHGIVNVGMNGSPALSAAQNFDTTLLNSGGGSNPYLDATFKQAAGATQNQLASEFGGAGRNVAASEPLRAEQLNNLATGIYGGAYQQDMQDALAAGNQAQELYGTQLGGLQTAEGVGQQVQNQAQDLINASKSAYDYSQQEPWQNLMSYESLLSGLQPGSTQTNPILNNPTANAANMASALEALMKAYAAA